MGGSRPKLMDLEGQFRKNRLDSRTDQNLRDTKTDFRRTTYEALKEEEKLKKQKELELELRNKYTSFYGGPPKESLRSSSTNNARLQNNFMKSNGFQAFKNNVSGEDDKDSSRYAGQMRNYDKPWLINSTNRELSSTQKVVSGQAELEKTLR